jgi:hypothetical protein
VKLPVKVEHDRVEMVTGETAESLIVYPMDKWGYAEPLVDLLVRARQLLESDSCRFLIVVGYTFRDDHIRRMIWDAARTNKALTVVLVDPRAPQLYAGRLEYYDATRHVPSSLKGRVVCLPYCFERVLPFLKLRFVHHLRDGLALKASARGQELRGERPSWLPAFRSFVLGEHVSEAMSIFDTRLGPAELNSQDNTNLVLPFVLAQSLFRIGNQTDGISYGLLFKEMLTKALGYQLEQIVVYKDRPDLPVVLQQHSRLAYVLRDIQGGVYDRAMYAEPGSEPGDVTTGLLRAALDYMNAIPNGYIAMSAYLSMRKGAWPDEVAALEVLVGPGSASTDNLRKAVIDIERKQLRQSAGIEVPEVR